MELTPQQKEFYASMEQTFLTAGWGLLAQGWRQEHESLSNIAFFNAKSMEDVQEARTRYRLISELLELPDTLAAQKQAILDDDGEDAHSYE